MKKLLKNKMFWMTTIIVILVVALVINTQIYQQPYVEIES